MKIQITKMNNTDCEKIEGKLVKELEYNEKYQVADLHNDNGCVRDVGEGRQIEKDIYAYGTEENNGNNTNSSINESTETEGTPTHCDANQAEQLLLEIDQLKSSCCEDNQQDDDGSPQPLSERWSPLGANYDDVSATSDLISPESELDCQEKQLCNDDEDFTRLRSMEEEQELLTSSLLALTSHFAHVQLRVRQIVEAPSNERDQLLKDLEEFAFRGIPESMTLASLPSLSPSEEESTQSEGTLQRQFDLIEQLKTQLSELEKLAYDSGAPVLPQHILLEKQKVIIDELKQKLIVHHEELNRQVDNAIGLKMKEQLVTQLKTQITDLERFIAFLQCDSVDGKFKTLTDVGKINEAYNSYAAKKKGASARRNLSAAAAVVTANSSSAAASNGQMNSSSHEGPQCSRESLNTKAHMLMDKASILMQMFATTHFGAKSEHFQKNTLKRTSKGDHWGDLRAQLEVDIQEVASLAATLSFDREKLANMKRALKKSAQNSPHNGVLTKAPLRSARGNRKDATTKQKELVSYVMSSDSDDDAYNCYDWDKCNRRVIATRGTHYMGDSIATISKELTAAIRKNFAITLQRLIQHGLRIETESATVSLIVPFMRCLHPSPVLSGGANHDNGASSFLSSSAYSADGRDDEAERTGFFGSGGTRSMHAWELIVEYYYLKHGDEFNNTPARKLSESFNLNIVDAGATTPKQNLLTTIGSIIAMHRPYKRSKNAHFKAFVCAALNQHQLVEWLNLIFNCTDLVETYYTPNSYVARTGFRDSLRSIDTLTKYDFDLPVDLAVRHFRDV